MGAGAGSACIGGGLALLAGGPAAPVEGSVAGPKEIHAQTGADRVRRPLQDAGLYQGGFAMKSLDQNVVSVAARSSNPTSIVKQPIEFSSLFQDCLGFVNPDAANVSSKLSTSLCRSLSLSDNIPMAHNHEGRGLLDFRTHM